MIVMFRLVSRVSLDKMIAFEDPEIFMKSISPYVSLAAIVFWYLISMAAGSDRPVPSMKSTSRSFFPLQYVTASS